MSSIIWENSGGPNSNVILPTSGSTSWHWGGWGQYTSFNVTVRRGFGIFKATLTLTGGEKLTGVTLNVKGRAVGATNKRLDCYLYTSDPTNYIPSTDMAGNLVPGDIKSGYIGHTYGTFNSSSGYVTVSAINFTGLSVASSGTLYFLFQVPSNGSDELEVYGYSSSQSSNMPTVTGTFKKPYTLSVSPASVTAGSKVTITIGNGSGSSITARIKYGSTQLWSGTTTTGSAQVTVANSWFTTAGVTGHSMSLTVTIDQNTSLSASFTAVKSYTLSVSSTSAATGSNVSITVGNGSGNSITARIKYGSTQLWSGASTNGSFSVAVNKSWFTTAGVATAKNMAVTVTIDQDTSLSAALTVTAGSNMNPTVGTLSFAPVNTGRVLTNFPNSYIAGYSKVKVSAAVTSGSNASISSVVLSFPGGTNVTMSYNSTSQKYEGTTAAVINGNTTFTVTAKDGRTLSGSKQGTLSGVVAYVNPSVSTTAANCYRCNSGGTKQDGGSYVSAKATATWYSSLSGNALTSFLFYIKEDRTAGYSDSRNLTSGSQSSPLQMHVPGANDYVTLVFSIQDKVSDAVTMELRLPPAPKNIYVRRSPTGTYLGVGMAPQRTSGKSDIELPDDGAVMVGGFLLQSLSHFNDPSYSGNSFGHDFLAINLNNLYDARNTTAKFYKPVNASGWSNCPVANTGVFYGVREVIIWSNYHCLVRLTELIPVAGRIWVNKATRNDTTGTIDWTGWKSITPV